MTDGYQVRLAENGRQLIKTVYYHEHLHLLIMDPDLPDIDVSSLMKKLNDRIPFLPVVVHTFPSDYAEYSEVLKDFPFVEKKGSSIEHLKQVVSDILQKQYSGHTQAEKNHKTR